MTHTYKQCFDDLRELVIKKEEIGGYKVITTGAYTFKLTWPNVKPIYVRGIPERFSLWIDLHGLPIEGDMPTMGLVLLSIERHTVMDQVEKRPALSNK